MTDVRFAGGDGMGGVADRVRLGPGALLLLAARSPAPGARPRRLRHLRGATCQLSPDPSEAELGGQPRFFTPRVRERERRLLMQCQGDRLPSHRPWIQEVTMAYLTRWRPRRASSREDARRRCCSALRCTTRLSGATTPRSCTTSTCSATARTPTATWPTSAGHTTRRAPPSLWSRLFPHLHPCPSPAPSPSAP